jgi:IS30 family transposase
MSDGLWAKRRYLFTAGVSRPGGIIPLLRCPSHLALNVGEREKISLGLAADSSLRHLAALLGRVSSTVMGEVARHGGGEGYRAAVGEARAGGHGRRPKVVA